MPRLLNDIEGHIVETDTHGDGKWVFAAFFVHESDATDFAHLQRDEPTQARVRPNPACRLLVA